MEYKKRMQRIVLLPVIACLLLSGCTCGRKEADDISYSEASCQVLMYTPELAGHDVEEMGHAGEN